MTTGHPTTAGPRTACDICGQAPPAVASRIVCEICEHAHQPSQRPGVHPCYDCARCDAADAARMARGARANHDSRSCFLCRSGKRHP